MTLADLPTAATLPASPLQDALTAAVADAAPQAAGAALPQPQRTIWGLDPVQLHTRYWASHGVQVVRQGEPSEIVKHAELYLLTDPSTLTLFKLGPLMDTLNWVSPTVLFVRLHDGRERGYRENAITDGDGKFVRFQRVYEGATSLTRIALTPDREVAQLWQSARGALQSCSRRRRVDRREHGPTEHIE